MSVAMTAKIDLLELVKRAEDHRHFRVGGCACLERKGKPWRVLHVAAVDDDTVTTQNGYVYNRSSGKRLVPAEPSRDELRPLTREAIEYLIVQEFLETASRLKLMSCSDQQLRKFTPLALSFLTITRELTQKNFIGPT